MRKYAVLIALVISAALLTASCSIVESDQAALGAVRVTAIDTTSGTQIEGASIFLDGAPRVETTPAVLGGVKEGPHEIRVLPQEFAYGPKTIPVNVSPPDTTAAVFNYAAATDPGRVVVSAENGPASILVNEQFYGEDETTPDTLSFAAGDYLVSVYRQGYKTIAPVWGPISVFAGETSEMTFQLEALETGDRVDKLVPDFRFPTDHGDTLSIAQFRGRVVLVNFWFYNCEACRDEFPAIEQTFVDRSPDGFRILAINTGWTNDTDDRYSAIRDELGLTFPLLKNTAGLSFTTETFNLNGAAPTNFLVDETGTIRYRFGATTFDDLNDKLNHLFP